MKMLSARFINRLIVLALLGAPIVYMFAILIFGLGGAHGSFDISNTALWNSLFPNDNWLVQLGLDIVDNGSDMSGFSPFAELIAYLDSNMLHFYENGSSLGAMAYGYVYYCAHVLIFDVVFYAGTFILRIFKKLLYKMEGDY